jgi:hypothetical protein
MLAISYVCSTSHLISTVGWTGGYLLYSSFGNVNTGIREVGQLRWHWSSGAVRGSVCSPMKPELSSLPCDSSVISNWESWNDKWVCHFYAKVSGMALFFQQARWSYLGRCSPVWKQHIISLSWYDEETYNCLALALLYNLIWKREVYIYKKRE